MKRVDRLDVIEEEISMSPSKVSVVERSAAVSVGKVAVEFAVTPATVRNWIEKGYVRSFTLPSGHHRIPRSEINRLLEQMDVGLPVEDEESTRKVRGTMVPPDEDWGPGGP